MSQERFTKEEAQKTIDALMEVMNSNSALLGYANDIMLFLEAAKRAAPSEER